MRFAAYALVATCSPMRALSAQHLVSNYEKIGDAASGWTKFECQPFGTTVMFVFGGRCAGDPRTRLATIGHDDEALIARLYKADSWEGVSDTVRRAPASPGGSAPHFRVAATKSPHRMKLRKLNADGMIVAKLHADPMGPKDKRYGIGGFSDDLAQLLDTVFFIAIGGYDELNLDESTDSSRRVSQWYVYGVDKSTPGQRKLVRVGNTGSLRWCRHPHDQPKRDSAATFVNCQVSKDAQRLLSDKMALTALMALAGGQWAAAKPPRSVSGLLALVRSIPPQLQPANPFNRESAAAFGRVRLFDPSLAPVWLTCGVGCCTADDS
ncbi:MAG: hypothetical protein IT353_01405 [Gemmatimonadaceae bacterium]|nr:hypothetical protein [Gemmatimonadaceae bacterium]